MIELLISLTVLIIGVAAVMSLQLSAMRASAFSRHAQEAAVLGEDVLEALRTIPPADLISGGDTDPVDERGVPDPDEGFYTRTWNVEDTPDVSDDPEMALVTVTVSWLEYGSEPHAVVFRTERSR